MKAAFVAIIAREAEVTILFFNQLWIPSGRWRRDYLISEEQGVGR